MRFYHAAQARCASVAGGGVDVAPDEEIESGAQVTDREPFFKPTLLRNCYAIFSTPWTLWTPWTSRRRKSLPLLGRATNS